MTTPTIRAALKTFQQAANSGIAIYLSPELVQELREALEAEPEGEPSDKDFFRVAEQAAHIDQDAIFDALEEGYPLELTAVDILEICRAVYRLARPAAPPAPEPGDAGDMIDDLHRVANALSDEDLVCPAHICRRAATLIAQQAAELAALRGVPVWVSERLPGEGDCDADGFCWNGYGYSYDDKNEIDSYATWTLVPATDLRGEAWLPAHAIPLPAPQAGEGEA